MGRTLYVTMVLVLLLAAAGGAQFEEKFKQAAAARDLKGATEALRGLPFAQVFDFGRRLQLDILGGRDAAGARDTFGVLQTVVEKLHKTRSLTHLAKLCASKGADYSPWFSNLAISFNKLIPLLNKAFSNDQQAMGEVLPQLQELAKQAAAYGDMERAFYYSGIAYNIAYAMDRNAPAGARKAVAALRNSSRKAWDLPASELDKVMNENGGSGDRESSGPKTTLAYAAGSKWNREAGEFKVWRKPFSGVSQITSAHPILWMGTVIRGIYGKGPLATTGVGKINAMKPPIQILRLKTSTYGIDANCDGKPEKTFRLKNKPSTIVFEQEVEGVVMKRALTMWVGGANEKIGNLALDFSPDMNYALVCFRGATCKEVSVDGKKILFIDEDASGGFGDTPAFYSPPRCEPYGQMICDSMILPGQRKPVPFSDFIALDGVYYKFKFSPLVAKFRKLDMNRVPMGRLRLVFKGPGKAKPKILIVGEMTELSGANFDLAGARSGVEVPVGSYCIMGGLILKGKGDKSKSVSIGTSQRPKQFKVEAGKETVIQIGAPFKFDFKYKKQGSTFVVDGLSLKVMGSAGEVYMDPWGAPPAPQVWVRKTGGSGSRKAGEMEVINRTKMFVDYLQQKRQSSERFSYEDALLAPMDFYGKVPAGADTIQVRLKSTRHPYFGKVSSDWK